MRSPLPHRRVTGLLVGALVFCLAPVAAAQPAGPPSGDALEGLRERARLVSAYQTLAPTGALRTALRSPASATARPGVLKLLELKSGLSRFARGSGFAGSAGANVGIGTSPERDENEPTVAADPRDEDLLVAGSHSFDPATQINHCVAYASRNGGEAWSAPVEMRQLTPQSSCSDPVLAYAPDGRFVYYAYMDIKFSESVVGDPQNPELVTLSSELDILVSRSADDGRTWSVPFVALDANPSSVTFVPQTGEVTAVEPGFDYDKPWIATHVPAERRGESNRRRVYVSATRFDSSNPGFACAIEATRSLNRGTAWSRPVELDSSGGDCGDPVLVQGSRPSGGVGDDVLVAWYHSGTDGVFQGSFEIRTGFSGDGGRRFRRPVRASVDSFEAPFFLGPFAFYHRWSGAMFPDLEIASDGRAHIVYTHDPAENGFTDIDPETGEEVFLPDVSTTAEDGDIRYITSRHRRYGSWSAPLTLNDDRRVRAQGYAALETSPGDHSDTKIRVIWEDHRLSPEVAVTDPFDPAQFQQSSNRFYDVFTTSRDHDGNWSRNTRVTDRSSISDFFFIGDYFDLAPTDDDAFFGIWTDRRHQTSTGAAIDENGNFVIDEAALEDNVFGASSSDHHGDDDDDRGG